MENKQTAVEKLAEILDSMIAKSLMAPQDKETTVGYQAAVVEVKKYIGGLLLMEKEQIKNAYKDCHDLGHIYGLDTEEYYNEKYANDTTTGLPEEDSKRRAWHY
jgi:hypothetical protein